MKSIEDLVVRNGTYRGQHGGGLQNKLNPLQQPCSFARDPRPETEGGSLNMGRLRQQLQQHGGHGHERDAKIINIIFKKSFNFKGYFQIFG